jgi:V8-like Glu-specific endopeptidase
MKFFAINTCCAFVLIFCNNAFAQVPAFNRWKKTVVKIESVQQRYTPEQVDVLLQKTLDSIGHVISQHETADIRNAFSAINDTIRGTGVMISDNAKIYMVTAKHIIKATELSNGLETIGDHIAIRIDATDKKTNEISLLNLTNGLTRAKPFVLSSDEDDLAIISFQKTNYYKLVIAYMKQNGVAPIPLQSIGDLQGNAVGNEILTVGFPALHRSIKAEVSNGKITTINKSAANFKAALTVYPGNSGGPVIQNDKLIGILSYQSGILNNMGVVTHPFAKATSATVIKASNILPLLRKLQVNEQNPTFNK